MSTSRILESSRSIEMLWSLRDSKCLVAIVWTWIGRVINIVWHINIYTSDLINERFKSFEVYHEIVLDRYSGNFSYLRSESTRCLHHISLIVVVERCIISIDFSLPTERLVHIEVSWNRKESHTMSFWIKRSDHDSIREITTRVLFSSITEYQCIYMTFVIFLWLYSRSITDNGHSSLTNPVHA